MREPTIRDSEGSNRKPDLVVKNREGIFVVDVTVRHEDEDYLHKGRAEKIGKYTSLLSPL
jgi:Holliday junction resolvase